MDSIDWLLLLGLAGLWGASFYFTEICLRELTSIASAFGRITLGALSMLAILVVTGERLPRGRIWLALAAMGLLNNVIPFNLIVLGQTEIQGGEAAVLNATTPIFTILLAHVATADERLSARRGFGVLLGFAGVVVMIGPDVLAGALRGGLAQAAVVLAALSYACAGVFGRRFLRGLTPTAAAAGMLVCATAWLAPIALLWGELFRALPSAAVWGALAGIGVLGTAVAYLLYFTLLSRAGATNLLLVTQLIPVVAILLGIAFLDQWPPLTAYAGMALITFSLAIVDGRVPWPRALARRRATG